METLPKIGDQAFVAGINFPLTVQAYDPNTKTAALTGEHPETGMDVQLPRVCLSLLQDAKSLAVGNTVRLNSGSPLLTVTCVEKNICWLIAMGEDGVAFAMDAVPLACVKLSNAN